VQRTIKGDARHTLTPVFLVHERSR
jgi:hypothetical protein